MFQGDQSVSDLAGELRVELRISIAKAILSATRRPGGCFTVHSTNREYNG
jgi:hypothetical protein